MQSMRLVATCLCVVVAAPCNGLTAEPAGDEAAPSPRIAVAGTLQLPDSAPTGDGATIEVAGVSGVTWLGADRWAAVMDSGAAFLTFALDLDPAGEPRGIRDVRAVRLAEPHDYEDLAPCPPGLAGRLAADGSGHGRLLLCEEDTPAIHVVDEAGTIVGGVALPAPFARRRPNRGCEAVCTAADGATIWTATEEALPDDGPPPDRSRGTVVRLVAAAADGSGLRQFAYAVDPPHLFVPVGAGEVYSGVVALACLDDGRLLVLERSAGRGLPPFENRLYAVDTRTAAALPADATALADRPEARVAKRLLWRAALGCNLEGLALGPALAGGGIALVAVADAEGLDAPNHLVVLRMGDPLTSP